MDFTGSNARRPTWKATRSRLAPKAKGQRYEGDVDYFGVYEPSSGHVYMIPIEVIGSRHGVFLRIDGSGGERSAERYRLR